MPLNMILLFACGLLLGLLFRKNSGQERGSSPPAVRNGAAVNSPFRMTSFDTSAFDKRASGAPSQIGTGKDDDAFTPQLANLQIALGTTRAPGRAYSAARAAGILR